MNAEEMMVCMGNRADPPLISSGVSMQLPFTVEQFYEVFRAYNETLWPTQVFLFVLALAAVGLAAFPRRGTDIAVSAILAFFWAWLGLAYHLAFFASINPLAYVFSAVSVAGAAVFLWHGVVRRRLKFRLARCARTAVGLSLVIFALGIYPAWTWYAGHHYPASPTFGLPCPTTIFTVGMLAFLVAPYPRSLFAAPFLWCLVGSQAAFLLGATQDLGLLVAAIVAAVLIVRSRLPDSQVAAPS